MKHFSFAVILLLRAAFCFATVPEYNLRINIAPDSKQMSVQGEVTIPAHQQQQDKIQFALSELIPDVRVEIIHPFAEKNPAITKTNRPWARPGWGQNTWTITPKSVVPANTSVVLRFQYRYTGDKKGFVLSASDRCFFASGINSAWYPQVEESPRTDDGIRLKGLRSIGHLTFDLPSGWSVYSPGRRRTAGDRVEFHIDQPVFLSFAAGQYSLLEISDPLSVSLYQLQQRGERMTEYARQAARILEILSAEFGNYVYPAFAILEVPPDEANDAGFAGASLDGFMLATTDFMNQEFNSAYYGHEIGHQWWGNLVRTDGPEARWILAEGLAQYGSLRAVELLEGATRAELYRRKGYPGYIQDQSGFGYLMVAAAGADQPLTKLPADESVSRWLADSKGFLVLDMLSRHMGREKFSSSLKSITTKYAGRRIHWNNFKKEVQNFSADDIGWFFKQWFEQTGAPEWKSEWEQQENGKLSLKLTQHAPPYFRFTVPAQIVGKEKQILIRQLSIDAESENWEWDVPFQVVAVEINPHFETLAWTEEYKNEAIAMASYTRAMLQMNDGNAKEAQIPLEEGLKTLPSPDLYGMEFLLHHGLAGILYHENDFEQSKKHIEMALNAPVKRPERLPWTYLLLAEVADKQNNPQLVCSSLNSVLTADQSAPQKTGAAEQIDALRKKHRCTGQIRN